MPDLQFTNSFSLDCLPRVSVIIPTYHDWDRLSQCICAILRQTYPRHLLEIIVVNNDPCDNVPNGSPFDQCTITVEAKAGSYAARNRGLIVANGAIVAFTDSDCVPHDDWIEMAVHCLMDGAERVAGHIELSVINQRLTAAETYEKVVAFQQERCAAKGISVTANMITWKHHFDTVGLFNDSMFSGGDMDWGRRATALGIGITYCSEARVTHPARHTIRELLKKTRRTASGMRERHPQRYRSAAFRSICRSLLPPIGIWSRLLRTSELNYREKAMCAVVAYVVKLYGAYTKTVVFFKLSQPQRS